MILTFRQVAASPTVRLNLQDRLTTAVQNSNTYFKQNQKGNDCQSQVAFVLRELTSSNEPSPRACPCSPAYEIRIDPFSVKTEYSGLIPVGTLVETESEAATEPEFSHCDLIDMTQPVTKQSIIFQPKSSCASIFL